MKLVGAISTAVLSLTLGAAAPVYAQQDQHDQQEEQKDKPAQQDEKKAQPEKPAKPAEKSAEKQDKNAKPEERNAQQQDKNAKPEEKNAQQAKPAQPAQRAIVSRPTSDRDTLFVSAKAITIIVASNTAVIGLDLLACGQATGSTRKTFM